MNSSWTRNAFRVLRITQIGKVCTVVQANVDAKKTSGMFLRIAQNGDSVQSLSGAIAPSRADERRSAQWRLCALDAPSCCSFFVLSTSVTLLLERMKSMFLSGLPERPRNHVRWCSS